MNNLNRIAGMSSRWPISIVCLLAILLAMVVENANAFAFAWTPSQLSCLPFPSRSRQPTNNNNNGGRIITYDPHQYNNRDRGHHHSYHYRPSSRLHALHQTASIVEAAMRAQEGVVLADYAPAAASLFSNMKLPSAVLTAGMISLGFATRFPELPRDSLDKVYSEEIRARCSKLERLHILLSLISVTSELIVVLWAAVEVNNLTERAYLPAYSVWDLINREADLAWSAVNSHFIMGIIGFSGMLWLRAYVMLLAANASKKLMAAASSGTAAALCLLISIVNRGVESGGGNSIDRYGSSILDLLQHYAMLLVKAASDADSPGPLQLSAILLESTSLFLLFVVLLTESDATFEELLDEDSCPIDTYEILNDDEEVAKLSPKELDKLKTCMILEDEDQIMRQDGPSLEEEERQQRLDDDAGDSSVNVM